jgi:hypothetical protein
MGRDFIRPGLQSRELVVASGVSICRKERFCSGIRKRNDWLQMMTDEELEAIGMTREEWDRSLKEEETYITNWAARIDPDKL